jgi:hypothetical protein
MTWMASGWMGSLIVAMLDDMKIGVLMFVAVELSTYRMD